MGIYLNVEFFKVGYTLAVLTGFDWDISRFFADVYVGE